MFNMYNPQITKDRIDSQIAQLQQMKEQLPPIQQPTNLTQNFQLANNQVGIKYVNNIDEVNKEMIFSDTPFFSKDMSVLWVKNVQGDIKAYSLEEIIQKDEKDLLIENLQMQINELKEKENAKSNVEYVPESIKDEKSTNGKSSTRNDKK